MGTDAMNSERERKMVVGTFPHSRGKLICSILVLWILSAVAAEALFQWEARGGAAIACVLLENVIVIVIGRLFGGSKLAALLTLALVCCALVLAARRLRSIARTARSAAERKAAEAKHNLSARRRRQKPSQRSAYPSLRGRHFVK